MYYILDALLVNLFYNLYTEFYTKHLCYGFVFWLILSFNFTSISTLEIKGINYQLDISQVFKDIRNYTFCFYTFCTVYKVVRIHFVFVFIVGIRHCGFIRCGVDPYKTRLILEYKSFQT